MTNEVAEPGASYGGPWTIEKLNILEKYLDAYTTVLKKMPFKPDVHRCLRRHGPAKTFE